MLFKIIFTLLATVLSLQAELIILHSSSDGKTRPTYIPYINQLQKIAEKNGIKIKFKPTLWKEALLMLEKGEADGVMFASYNDERAKYALYPMKDGKLDSNRRLNNGKSYYIYKNRNSTLKWDGKKFTDVDGAVGAVVGFAVIADLKKHNNIKIVIKNSKKSLLKDVATGKISAYAGISVDVDKILKEHPEFAKRIVRESLAIRKKDYFLVFSKKNYNDKKIEMKKIWNGLSRDLSALDIDLTYQEKEYLRDKKSIKMCVDPNWMPYEKIEKGKHIGLASDFMQLVSQKIDTPINLVKTKSWDESIQKAKNRECDIFSMASITKDRLKYMNFTEPYITSQLVVATKNSEIYIDDINEYLDKSFGAVKGYSLIKTLKVQYPTIKVVEVDSVNDGLSKVERGEIFAYLDNNIVIMYEIQKYFLGRVAITGKVDKTIDYGVGTRNDEPILNEIFNKAILSIDRKQKQYIINSWVNLKSQKIDYTLVRQIISLSIIIMIIGLSMVLILRSKNRNLNKIKNELFELNNTLEQRVADEVKQNQYKDQMLYQQSKMASMGEMIGNIAHQWRQPITIISMWANNIIVDIDMDTIDNDNMRDYAKHINEQTNHLSQTIDDFRNFFIPNKNKTTFTLKSSIEKIISLLMASFKTHNIEVIENIQKIEITALENELMQAILNIVKNAKDILITMPQEKRRLIFINIYKQNKNIVIEIKDNGGGIPKDIIDKVFEPYFTTKHKSQGTGIGLYMTESIITKHLHGEVNVENIEYVYEDKKYVGALFKIVLT